HQAAHVRQPVGGVLQQQGVGAIVDRDAAARRQQRIGLRLDERRHVLGLGVVHLQVLGAQRRELLHVLPRGQLGLLAAGELGLRRHDDDVVLPALVEPLGAQHDIERLVHGTFCSRRVTLPLTESLTTMFWPLASASSCSTARVSMSWKFSVRRSPVYTGRSSWALAALRRGAISTTYWSSDW